MSDNMVSIILPTYNRAYCLQESVETVLHQSYDKFELILVDDGSTDGTEELVSEWKDDRIRYCKTSLHQGASAARNYGIQQVQGKYIAFQDSDDLWHSDKLAKQIKLLEQTGPEVGFSYHKIVYCMEDHSTMIIPSENILNECKSGDIYEQLLWDNLVPCPALVIKKEVLEEIGLFDTSLKALEDYDLALRVAKQYQALFVDEILVDATFSPTGVSSNVTNYLTSSCLLIQKYKKDYLITNTLDHRLEIIFNGAKEVGLQEQYVAILEKIMML